MTWPRRGLIGNSQQNKSSGGMLTPRSFDASVNTFSDFGMLPWGSLYTTDLVSDNTNFFGARSFHVSYDGRYLFVYYAGDDVIRFPLSTPYDISTKSLNPDQTLTDSTLGELNGSLVSWSNDGYHMYVSGSDDDNLQDWQAETPWSLTNIRYGGRVTFDNANLSGGGRGVFWKPDGLKLFIVTTADNIYQYTLTSAWDMSTASYDGSGSISSDVGNPFGLHFSTDGDKVFVMEYTGSHVTEFSLSTAWDVTSGLTYESEYSTTSIANGNLDYPDAFAMSNDGTKFYGTDGYSIYQWTLDDAWDLDGGTGITFNGTRSIGGSTISGLSFTSDGTQLVMSERGGNTIRVFSLSTAYDIYGSTTITQQMSFSPKASYVPYNINDSNHWYNPDVLGDVHITNNYLFLIDADISPSSDQPILHRFNLKVSGDPTSIDHGSHESSNESSTSLNSIHWTPDGKKFIIVNDFSYLYHYTTSIPWNTCRNFVTYDGSSTMGNAAVVDDVGAVVIAPDGKNILVFDDSSEELGQGYLSDYFQPKNGSVTKKFETNSSFYSYLWLKGDYYSQCAQISANHEMLYILSSNTDILQLRLQTY